MSLSPAAGRHNTESGRATPDARSILRAELARIAEGFAAADRRAFTAGVYDRQGHREAAEAERAEAAGNFWAAEADLADLLLLLLRAAARHQPDALRLRLGQALRTELEPLAEAVARLEARR